MQVLFLLACILVGAVAAGGLVLLWPVMSFETAARIILSAYIIRVAVFVLDTIGSK